MVDVPEIFNQPNNRFVLLYKGIKFPPMNDGWQLPENAHPFQEAKEHNGNVGLLAGYNNIGLDQDEPSAFTDLKLPPTTTWETRPGRFGMSFLCDDRTPEILTEYGKKPNQAQIYLYKEGLKVGEIKLERTYQVIPPSWKTLEDGTKADYKMINDVPPTNISLAKLFEDLIKIGITFNETAKTKTPKPLKVSPGMKKAVTQSWVDAAVEYELDAIRGQSEGNRNNQLNLSAFALGQLVGAGLLDEMQTFDQLKDAADETGLEESSSTPTIESGLSAGMRSPRDVTIFKGDSPEIAEGEMTEEEFEAYSMPPGPKFECNLPKDHFVQRFMAYGSDVSDAYPDYWFAGGIYILSVIADKKIKLVLRQGTVYPNLYISINGKSSLSRKSTVVDKTESMLYTAMPKLMISMVPTEFSPEAFTEHMDQFNHSAWIRDEAAGVLSLMKKDYMRGFKDSLMQLYDCKPYHRKLRTSQRKNTQTEFKVEDPYLNVLFATTDASLGANTEENDLLTGFMARFLFFFPQGEKPKWMPLEEGNEQNSMFEEIVLNQLKGIVSHVDNVSSDMRTCVTMHFSQASAEYFTEWQRLRELEWTHSNDGFCMQIYSRLAPTVAKLGLLFELGASDFDATRPIRLTYIQEACQLVDSYFMPTARAVYDIVGSNAEKNVIDKIIAYLKNHGGKATKKEISRDVKIKSKDFDEYLETMLENDMVEAKTVHRGKGKSGRPSIHIFLSNSGGNFVGKSTIIDKIDIVDIVERDGRVCVYGESSTKSTKPTKSINSISSANIRGQFGYDTKPTIAEEISVGLGCEKEKEDHFKTPEPQRKESFVCAKCGEPLVFNGKTLKGYVKDNGKTYCAQVGCGYLERSNK